MLPLPARDIVALQAAVEEVDGLNEDMDDEAEGDESEAAEKAETSVDGAATAEAQGVVVRYLPEECGGVCSLLIL